MKRFYKYLFIIISIFNISFLTRQTSGSSQFPILIENQNQEQITTTNVFCGSYKGEVYLYADTSASSYQWYENGKAITGATKQIYSFVPSYSPNQTYYYTVTATKTNPISGASYTENSEKVYQDNLSVNISGNGLNNQILQLCSDSTSTVELIATAYPTVPYYSYYYNYSWTGPSGATILPSSTTTSNSTTDKVTVNTPGTYSVTVTDYYGCSAQSSTKVESSNLSVDINSTEALFCNTNGKGILEANVTGGTPYYTYSWTGPTGATISPSQTKDTLSTTNLVTVDQLGYYTVSVTDYSNCTATANFDLNSKYISKFSATIVGDGPNNEILELCHQNPKPITLIANLKDGIAPYDYIWQLPASNAIVSSNLAGYYSPANPMYYYILDTNDTQNTIEVKSPGYYKLEAIDYYGCSTTASAYVKEDDLSAIVNNGDNQYPLCSNGKIVLTAKPINGVAPYMYNWFQVKDDQYYSVGSQDYYVATEPGYYLLEVTDRNNCSYYYMVNVENIIDQLSVVINSNISNSYICAGDNVTLNAIAINGQAPYSYSWTGPNGFMSSDQNISLESIKADQSGIYTVTVTDNNGCSASSSILVKVFGAILAPNCSESGHIVPPVLLDVQTFNGQPPYVYAWYYGSSESNMSDVKNFGPVPVTSDSYFAENNGYYKVSVTDKNNCTVQSNTVVLPIINSCSNS